MSDIPLPVLQDFVDQFQDPSAIGQTGSGNRVLWQGTVTGIDPSKQRLTVKIAGKDVPKLRCLQWPPPQIGEYVWGVQEGRIKIVLGVLAPSQVSAEGVLAQAIVTTNTGGSCKGRWGDGSGAGVTSLPVGSTDTDLSLGVVNVPVRPNRLLRAKFRICNADHVAAAYSTVTMYANWNGAGFGPYRRSTAYYASFSYVPRIEEWIFPTPTNATTLSLKLYANTSAGTAYFYRYASYTGQDESFMELSDIGSSKDYTDQSGVIG